MTAQFETLWLDVETTGLHPARCGVVSVAALANWESDPAKAFYREVRPYDGAEINEAALFTNGFTREQLMDPARPSEAQVAEEFNAWAFATFSGPPIVAGMNVTFDVNFMGELYRRTGTVFGLRSRFLDVQDVAIFLHTAGLIELPYSGSFLRTNLGALLLTLTPGAVRSEKHTCFEDVWLTRNVYGAMLGKAARGG